MKIINPFEGKFELSKEQVDIVEACKKHKIVNIEAVAGSSKTTSLVVVSHNIKAKSMFLTFSKILAEEAKGEFPSYVDCRTIHSLAYRYVGKEYRHKLKRPTGAYKNVCGTGAEIAKYFKLDPIQIDQEEWITSAYIGNTVKNTLTKYENCWEDDVQDQHVPYNDIQALKDKYRGLFSKAIHRKFVKVVVRTARKLWKLRIDVESDVVCTHDTYQKVYCLSSPKIDTEVLYLDEVQDCSRVFIRLVQDQVKYGHCKIISVGDRHQSIYGFRHSTMLTDYVQPEKECHLTHSFRYGQKVADIAMKVLDCGKNIVGFDKENTQITDCLDVTKLDKVALLFRTNACLVEAALSMIDSGDQVNIEIDLSDYMNLLDSINALKMGKLKYVKHHEVLAYDDWSEFSEDVKNNPPVKRVFDVVDKGDYWRVKNLLDNHNNNPNNKFSMLTAHKSKGRTFPNVLLMEDFPSNFNKEGKWVGLDDEEKRLLYVAATRAQKNLGYNTTVKEILDEDNARNADSFIKKLLKQEDKWLRTIGETL